MIAQPNKKTVRVIPWVHTKTRENLFGLQVKLNDFDCRWLHCCKGSEPLLFDTIEEARAEARKMRKEWKQQAIKP